jgi:IS605 OrfB family transposase
MLLTLMVKLAPAEEQKDSLLKTMHRFNEACNYIAEVAYSTRCANKVRLQKLVYYDVRERFGLSAQLTIRAIAKVVEAYKRDKSIKPAFRPEGAIVYDQRILSWKGIDRVSIVTLDGRLKIPVIMGEYQKARMDRVRGQADLVYRNGVFYLAVVVDVPEANMLSPAGTLGVDLGIRNLAVDSDGDEFSGEHVEKVRKRYAELRARLQSTGTKSAKRHLKRLSGKVRRFQRDINHQISKRLVAKAKGTSRSIAIEDLRGIRERITVRKAQRGRHHSWAFRQLRSFIEYKAALSGVPVVLVNPENTSRTCPECGYIDKRNRISRDVFRCVQCGFAGSADHTAAINIAARAAVNQPIVSGSVEHHFSTPQGQAHVL